MRGEQARHRVPVHVIRRAYPQQVWELLKHHDPKLIDADQSVARVLVAHPQRNVLVGRPIVRVRIVVVLDVRDAKDQRPIEELCRHVAILAGANRRAVNRLSFVLIDAVQPLRISHLLVKLFGLPVLVPDRFALLVEDGKDDGVTTPAERRRFDLLAVARRNAAGVLHRQRD